VAELVVGGKPRPLVKVLQAAPDHPYMPASNVLVMLSVPKDAPVQLRVADMDRVQTLDVRTGTRAADAIPGYYRTSTKKIDFERNLPVGVTVRGVPYPTPLRLIHTPVGKLEEPFAMLAPWTPVQGWAAGGRAWLVLPSPIVAADAARGPTLTLAIDEPTAFRVRLPDGAEVREVGGTQQVNTWTAQASAQVNLIFDVSADFVTGTYLIDIGTAGVTAEFSDGTLPARWQPAPPVVEVPLNLGS
jgi:hypothetical protein